MPGSLFFVSLVAAAIVVAVTPLMKHVARLTGAVAHPKHDRWHVRSVPMLGGVAIFAGVVAPVGVTGNATTDTAQLLLAGAGMFVLGLLDDLLRLKPITKLTLQIAVACAAIYLGPVPGWSGIHMLDALLGIVWIVAVTNAMNLLDNMDGLCAGVAAIAALASAIEMVNGVAGQQAYAAALAGASIGFLAHNFFPASIFMGDAGSLFLGASLAVLSFAGADSGSGIFTALAVPAFVLLIPLFDTTLVTMSRILSTRSVAQGGRDHTSHRLVAMGFSERQAVLFLWLLAAAGASIPLMTHVGTGFAGLIGPLLLIALILLGVQLARVRVYDGRDFSRLIDKSYTPLLVDITYKRRLFEIALDVVLISFSYYAAYLIRFDRDVASYTQLIDESLPIVIGCQVVSLYLAGVYRGTWRHMSLSDLSTYARGVMLGVVSTIIVLVYSFRFRGYSRGVFVIDAMMLGILLVGSRLSFRLVADAAGRRRGRAHPIVIYGAGDGGALVLRELRNNPEYDVHPVAFLDDDPSKESKRMMRVPIVGGIDRMDSLLDEERPEAIIVSTSKIPPERLAAVHAHCRARSIRVLQLRVNLEEMPPSAVASDRERIV